MDFGFGFDTPAPCHTARAADSIAPRIPPGRAMSNWLAAIIYGLRDISYGLWAMDYGLWAIGHGRWSMGYGLCVMGLSIVTENHPKSVRNTEINKKQA